ncbi:MAG: hypothetical protein Q8R57_05650 [Bacteroidota bacterium]|nr:hypothetical protein [Bacteroidota bacterium]
MNLLINNSKTIANIQDDFQSLFPYLKIEFFKAQHQSGEPSAKEHVISGSLTLQELNPSLVSGEIEVISGLKVGELEQLFAEKFGLSVQVFHKSGSVWLQTTRTDNWTLTEQNRHAEEKEHPISATIVDSMDRQELE